VDDLLLQTHFLCQAVYCAVANPFTLFGEISRLSREHLLPHLHYGQTEGWEKQVVCMIKYTYRSTLTLTLSKDSNSNVYKVI
jgi:hypothetical protein